jgi:hypothetical protein
MLAFPSCKSKKNLVSTPPPAIEKPSSSDLLLQKLELSKNSFSYFSSSIKAHFKDDKQDLNFDINLVMEKDRYIWANISALFGIGVARAFITKDSVIILDHLHRKCIRTDLSYFKKMANANFTLLELQQLFIGNPAFALKKENSLPDTVSNSIVVYTRLDGQKQTTTFNSLFKAISLLIEQSSGTRQLQINYSNPYAYGTNFYPKQIHINIRSEKNSECTLNLDNFVLEKKKDVVFTIPKTYELVRP